MTRYSTEQEIAQYWKKQKIFSSLRAHNRGKKRFSFLDGPITANNPMGVHHAWGRTLKDLYQRYYAMKEYDERYQNGFDCQGLWLEVEAEKELGFNSKKDIEKFGLDRFSQACRARVKKFSEIQTDQSILLGQWMDWGQDYFTMADDNIEAIWYFLKKCYNNKWLYKGQKILPWCIRCGTSSSKHEMSDEGYADLVHPSVYVSAKIKNRTNEYLLIWTTTEWTLSSNVAAAVNPSLEYARVQKEEKVYYISKAVVKKVGSDGVVLGYVKGSDLVGLEYESFYPDFEVQNNIVHRVIPWEDVGAEDGTGIVHIAPNCGDVDYELGGKLNLPIFSAALDEFGTYVKGYGWLTGKNVQSVKKEIVQDLEKRQILFKVENFRHRYPVCWRCKQELVFRLDTSWFISCDKIRPIMKLEAAKIVWYPEHVGKLMQDWLDNMEDWNISRRRYWGLPLMFYECESCHALEVIGSREELHAKAIDKKLVDQLPELHRPWIDAVKIKASCGHVLERIKDVGDCWLDAGIVPFSTLKYFQDKKYWKQWFPVDLEIEMRAQVRLWFYAQLFMSIVLEGVAPYKKVLAYEEVRDEKGDAMHKSRGNAIWFDEAVEKMGADVMRWLYCSQDPSSNLLFGFGPAREVERQLLIVENLARYVKENSMQKGKKESTDVASRWIISRRERLKQNVTKYLDELEYHKAMAELRYFILFDLSKTYVQCIRDELNDQGIQKVLYDSYCDAITLLAPFLPFVTEKINLDLFKERSIHLFQWPKPNVKKINDTLEEGMVKTQEVIQAILSVRDKAKINVRWPLKSATITILPSAQLYKKAIKLFQDLVKKQGNVKQLKIISQDVAEGDVLTTFGAVSLDLTSDPILEKEGFVRELIRRIQQMRKEQGLQKSEKITLFVSSSYNIKSLKKEIMEKVGAINLYFEEPRDCERQEFVIKDVVFAVGFRKAGRL